LLIAQAASWLGQPVTSAMVRGFAHCSRLASHGTDRLGRPLYRVGGVLGLAVTGTGQRW
jgi:hypothetical protein